MKHVALHQQREKNLCPQALSQLKTVSRKIAIALSLLIDLPWKKSEKGRGCFVGFLRCFYRENDYSHVMQLAFLMVSSRFSGPPIWGPKPPFGLLPPPTLFPGFPPFEEYFCDQPIHYILHNNLTNRTIPCSEHTNA